MKELTNTMNKIANDVMKKFDNDAKQRRKNWKQAIDGKLPLLIAFRDCKNESMRYKVLPINEVKAWKHDDKMLYAFWSESYKREQISIDQSGLLAIEIEKIRKERIKLIKKECRIIKKFYETGKLLKIDETQIGHY